MLALLFIIDKNCIFLTFTFPNTNIKYKHVCAHVITWWQYYAFTQMLIV